MFRILVFIALTSGFVSAAPMGDVVKDFKALAPLEARPLLENATEEQSGVILLMAIDYASKCDRYKEFDMYSEYSRCDVILPLSNTENNLKAWELGEIIKTRLDSMSPKPKMLCREILAAFASHVSRGGMKYDWKEIQEADKIQKNVTRYVVDYCALSAGEREEIFMYFPTISFMIWKEKKRERTRKAGILPVGKSFVNKSQDWFASDKAN